MQIKMLFSSACLHLDLSLTLLLMLFWNPDLIHTLRSAVAFATIPLVMNLLTLKSIREIPDNHAES